MYIIQKKGDKCPICLRLIKKPNCWVVYHVKYKPAIVLLACRYCNFVEYTIRTGHSVPFLKRSPYSMRRSRTEMVLAFHKKLGVDLTL